MTTEIVHAQWFHDQVFLLHDHAGYPVLMTQPDGVLAADFAHQHYRLRLVGHCVHPAKARQQITSVSASATSTRDTHPPGAFAQFTSITALAAPPLTPLKCNAPST